MYSNSKLTISNRRPAMADMNLKENIPEQEEKGIAMEITFYFIGNSFARRK